MTMKLLSLFAAICLIGCQEAPRPAVPPIGSYAVPTVSRIQQVVGPEGWNGHGGMAVDHLGRIAFAVAGKENDPRLLILDSTGRAVARFARTGDGPGEVRVVGSIWFDGDTLGAFDLMAQRAQRYAPDGKYLGTITLGGIGQPVGMTLTGLATVMLGPSGPSLSRVAADGEREPLLDPADPRYDSLVAAPYRDRPDPDRLPMPALAVQGDLVAFADAWTYRVAWGRGGKTFAQYGEARGLRFPSTAEVDAMRRSLETWRGPDRRPMDPGSIGRQVAHFAETAVAAFDRRPGFGMGFDGAGRLWIPRELPDSVAWDVLAPGRLLGTLTLSCPGGSGRGRSINGGFLAMECEGVADSVPVIQRWRIDQ